MSFTQYQATSEAFSLTNIRSSSVLIDGHHLHCSICGVVFLHFHIVDHLLSVVDLL